MRSKIEVSAFNCCMRSDVRTGKISVTSSSLVNCRVKRLVSYALLAIFISILGGLRGHFQVKRSKCFISTSQLMHYLNVNRSDGVSDVEVLRGSDLPPRKWVRRSV